MQDGETDVDFAKRLTVEGGVATIPARAPTNRHVLLASYKALNPKGLLTWSACCTCGSRAGVAAVSGLFRQAEPLVALSKRQ